MSKPKAVEPSLRELLSGVDIIGTILHTDLPRLERELAAIRESLATHQKEPDEDQAARARLNLDLAPALDEIRELLVAQSQRLEALERRVAHVADLCSPEARGAN